MTSRLLVVDNASRSYISATETVTAVRNVSLTAHAGEFVCVSGASGSGKSTLVSLITGLATADTGRILVEQADLGLLDASARARLRLTSIGVVFQDHNLVEEFTALENVALPLEAQGLDGRTQALNQLARLGLANVAHRFPRNLSGGQRQRVGLARALVGERRILVADEPTGAVDSRTARDLFALIRKSCDDGLLAIVCSHDPLCREIADTVYEMSDGSLRAAVEATA